KILAKMLSLRMPEKIIILDFGSQYTQLIARRVRELDVYREIHPYNQIPELDEDVKGVILSGSPCSVREADAPQIDLSILHGKYPLLGVCYGAQYIAREWGGDVLPSSTREYGRAQLQRIKEGNPLFRGLTAGSQVWMSHGDTISSIPNGFELIASTDTVNVAAFQVSGTNTYGIQFHPEVTHSLEGKKLLENFLVDICGCARNWTPYAFIESTIEELKRELGEDKVVLAISGGVDSSVAALLLHKAIGPRLHCIFVDNGLLRKNEFNDVLDSYQHMGLNIRGIDAKERFYTALAG